MLPQHQNYPSAENQPHGLFAGFVKQQGGKFFTSNGVGVKVEELLLYEVETGILQSSGQWSSGIFQGQSWYEVNF